MHPGRISQRVCGLAALLTLTLALTSVPRWRASDVPFLLFAVSPYLALGALSTRLRCAQGWAWVLLGLTAALSCAGVGCFALDSWTFHTMDDYRMVQRFTVIVVPMLQLLVTAPVALIVLIRARL